MEQYSEPHYDQNEFKAGTNKRPHGVAIYILLFLATLISTIIAGTFFIANRYDAAYEISNWHLGLQYGFLVMAIIAAHEFGHYFAARYHKVDATLPYFIPFPWVMLNPFGTMGAVIRTRSPIPSRRALFDIGVAGPLAGFAVCLLILIVGLADLPGKDYLYRIHPEYLEDFGGRVPEYGMFFGDTLLYKVLAGLLTNPNDFLPPLNEIYHYPFLCAGWFGMFITSLNLLPIGQLDGGHISYAMFGNKQVLIARVVWWSIFALGLGGLFGYLHINGVLSIPPVLYNTVPWFFDAWFGWLFWALFTRFVVKIAHPPVADSQALGSKRSTVGWLAFAVFILTFTFNGIYIVPPTMVEEDAIITRNHAGQEPPRAAAEK